MVARLLLLLLLLRESTAFSLLTPQCAAAAAASSVTPAKALHELELIEHPMPVMSPHLYEPMLRKDFESRGEILRWYIGRVEGDTAIAEVVLLR